METVDGFWTYRPSEGPLWCSVEGSDGGDGPCSSGEVSRELDVETWSQRKQKRPDLIGSLLKSRRSHVSVVIHVHSEGEK